MPKYIYVYHGGMAPSDPAEITRVMQAWTEWYQSMDSAVVDGGNPVGNSKTVSREGVADNGGANPVSGYTLVNAADMDAAVKMAKGCPITADGGSVEVAECIDM